MLLIMLVFNLIDASPGGRMAKHDTHTRIPQASLGNNKILALRLAEPKSQERWVHGRAERPQRQADGEVGCLL
jgi:hypothetical protein